MKLYSIFICGIAALAIACTSNNKPEEGTVKGQIYTSAKIGWTITIPFGWEMLSNDYIKKEEKKGKEAVQKQTGQTIDTTDVRNLVSFKKDKFNFLSSTSEPYTDDTAQYPQITKNIYDLLYKTMVGQGLPIDTSSGSVKIDGLKFYTFFVTVNNPNGGILLQQIYYNRLINGFDFGVNINYTNDSCKKIMLDAFMASKFDHSKK